MVIDQEMQDLQAVSQHVLTATDKIQKLELEKRSVPPGSVRFIELSTEIEQLAAELQVVSASETDLALEVVGDASLPTIEQADRDPGDQRSPRDPN